MAAVGKAFGLSLLQATRAGLLLAAGGEFAFVTFGEAVSHKILPAALVSKLFLIVSLSMALTPFLAEGGARLGKMFEKSDVKASQLFIYACCISPSSEQSLLGWLAQCARQHECARELARQPVTKLCFTICYGWHNSNHASLTCVLPVVQVGRRMLCSSCDSSFWTLASYPSLPWQQAVQFHIRQQVAFC